MEVKETTSEKIKNLEWMPVRKSGNRLYLYIDIALRDAFGLKKGDLLLVELKELRRAKEGDT